MRLRLSNVREGYVECQVYQRRWIYHCPKWLAIESGVAVNKSGVEELALDDGTKYVRANNQSIRFQGNVHAFGLFLCVACHGEISDCPQEICRAL
jgi:hypothetical protein